MNTYPKELQQASQFIEEHDDFLVVSHLHPDGDATGSVLAMAGLLKTLGKTYTVANEGETPQRFSFLDGFADIVNLSKFPVERKYATVIAVDVADQGRLGEATHFIAEDAALLNIDHHPTNTRFGQVNVLQPGAASTTEIVYDLIRSHFPDALHATIAEPLYTGLLTDTGGFRYANTNRKGMEMAAHLLSFGLQPGKIAEHSLETITAAHLELLKRALNRLTYALGRKVALISVTEADRQSAGAGKDDVDGLVSYPRNIDGVQVGVLLKEMAPNEIKVSLRSKDEIDVGAIAQTFGGGGHAKAAGYTFAGTLAEAQQTLLQHLTQAMGDGQ